MADIALPVDVAETGERTTGALPRARRNWDWLGLVPFFAFLVLFLIVPAFSVFRNALRTDDGYSFEAMKEAMSGQNAEAFWFTIKFSSIAAAVGVVLGALLAYAAATATRPRWLRNLVSSFSGVAANMGGIPLAFAFITLLGRQGLMTKIINESFNTDIWADGFSLGSTTGLIVVYCYFNIPLMVLITLPAIDGIKMSWREACANLGGTTLTFWRRVGLPVLAPSLMGGFLLLFANSFSAYATAAALTDNSEIISRRIGFFLGGDMNIGEDAVGFALAAWMIVITAVTMALYWFARRRAERWQR